MTEHDDSLEVGVAAGMDIPTAMVMSAHDKLPRQTRGIGCSPFLVLAVIAGLVGMVIVRLLP
jgi:hypothetical protein